MHEFFTPNHVPAANWAASNRKQGGGPLKTSLAGRNPLSLHYNASLIF
jgi:hypothetical protein